MCVISLFFFFNLFLKGTGGGLPDLYDLGLGLCDTAWLIIDKNSGCYQLLIPGSWAYF